MTALTVKTERSLNDTPEDWCTVERSAALLVVTEQRIRQQCSEWSKAGLAKKVNGRWLINPSAHPRLAEAESFSARDVRQITELRETGLNDKDMKIALQRREIVRGVESFGPRTGTGKHRRETYLRHIRVNRLDNKHAVPSERTLRRWADCYFKQGIAALAPNRKTCEGISAIGSAAWELFVEIVGVGHGIKATQAYDQVVGYRIEKHLTDDSEWAWPSLRTVQRAYCERVSKPLRTYCDKDPKKFRALCIPKITRDWSKVSAGDVLGGDERTFDFFARVESDRGPRAVRLKLTAWLCPRSNFVSGWYIGKLANSDTILSSLKAACLVMSTLPRAVIIDNGTDYRAVGGKPRRGRKWDALDDERISSAFGEMQINTNYAIPYAPWAKPIESIFRNLSEFDRFAASYTDGKPDERPHDTERWIKANIDKLSTVDEVRLQFAEWLEAYHSTPQRGDKLNNLSPQQAFDQFGIDARSEARMLNTDEKITDGQRIALISELCDWSENHKNGEGKPMPWAELGAKIGVSGSTLVVIRKGKYKADDSHVLRRVDEFLADERVRIGRFDARTFSRIDLTHKIKGAIVQAIKHNTIGVIIGEPGSGKIAHARWFVGQRENAVLVEPDDADCDQRRVIDSIYKALGLFGRNQRFRRDKKRVIVDYLKRHKSTVIVIDEAQKLTRSALEMLRRLHDLSDPQGLRNVAIILFADEDFYRLIVRYREGQRTPISAQISRRLYPIFDIATHGCDRNRQGEAIEGTVYKPGDIEAITRNQRLRVFDGRGEINWLVRLANVRGHGHSDLRCAFSRSHGTFARGSGSRSRNCLSLFRPSSDPTRHG